MTIYDYYAIIVNLTVSGGLIGITIGMLWGVFGGRIG